MKRGSDGYSKYPYFPKSLVKVWKSNSFKSFRTVSVYLIATSQQLERLALPSVLGPFAVHLVKFILH